MSNTVTVNGLWKGGGRTRKLCDKPFSHPPLLPGPTTLPTSRRVYLKRMLCARSCSALSQPQLYRFKSLAPELFVYRPHSIDCIAKSKSVGWSRVHTAHAGTLVISCFLCSRLSSSGTEFNNTKKKATWVAVSFTVKLTAPCPRLLDSEHGLSFTQLCEVGVPSWFVAL